MTGPSREDGAVAELSGAARRGELALARRRIEAALSDSDADSCRRVQLLNLMGGIAFEQGRLDTAEAAFEEVMRLARAAGAANLAARAANNLASIAHVRGKEHLAISLYESSLQVWRLTGDATGEAQTSHNLALVYRESGDLPAAAGESERAVAAARRSGDYALEGLTRMGRAEVALSRGDLPAAKADLAVANRLSKRTADALGIAEGARIAGAIALAEGRFTVALRAATRGYRMASRVGGLQVATECAELSYRAGTMLRRARLARRFYRTAFDGYRALGATPALRRLRTRSAD